MIKPEQLSLIAHEQVTTYLDSVDNQNSFTDQDVNAILRLSQHLRVFGLLSAVRYISTSNNQEGRTRERTIPIWRCLLAQLISNSTTTSTGVLKAQIIRVAAEEPQKYMQLWNKSLMLANHWNFWARAYKEASQAENERMAQEAM